MSSACSNRHRDVLPLACRRHFLPGDGQKLPRKVLKNIENPPPGLFSGTVQGSKAAWIVRHGHVGLEIEG